MCRYLRARESVWGRMGICWWSLFFSSPYYFFGDANVSALAHSSNNGSGSSKTGSSSGSRRRDERQQQMCACMRMRVREGWVGGWEEWSEGLGSDALGLSCGGMKVCGKVGAVGRYWW